MQDMLTSVSGDDRLYKADKAENENVKLQDVRYAGAAANPSLARELQTCLGQAGHQGPLVMAWQSLSWRRGKERAAPSSPQALQLPAQPQGVQG